MKCSLKIDHKDIKKIYKDTMFFCHLYKKDTGSMIQTGVLCAHCCLKSQQVCDALSDLLLRQEITKDSLNRDPECFYPYLRDDLRVYAEEVGKATSKTWLEISSECARCKPTPVKPKVVTEVKPTGMAGD